MLTPPASVARYLQPASGNRTPQGGERFIIGPGDHTWQLAPGDALLTEPSHPAHLPLLNWLHTHRLTLHCHCLTDQSATSHVKRRLGVVFFARNPSSPEHDVRCPLFSARRAGQTSVDDSQPSLTDTDGLMRIFLALIRAAGADTWSPAHTPRLPRDWVSASALVPLGHGRSLSEVFKAKVAFLDDLRARLQRMDPPGTGALLLNNETPPVPGTLPLDDQALTLTTVLSHAQHCPVTGLIAITPDTASPAAVFFPVAGKRHRFPCASDHEAQLVGRLMAKAYHWHTSEHYGHTLTVHKPWQDSACDLQISEEERGTVAVLLTAGAAAKRFHERYGDRGLILSPTDDLNTQYQQLEAFVFRRLIARAKRAG